MFIFFQDVNRQNIGFGGVLIQKTSSNSSVHLKSHLHPSVESSETYSSPKICDPNSKTSVKSLSSEGSLTPPDAKGLFLNERLQSHDSFTSLSTTPESDTSSFSSPSLTTSGLYLVKRIPSCSLDGPVRGTSSSPSRSLLKKSMDNQSLSKIEQELFGVCDSVSATGPVGFISFLDPPDIQEMMLSGQKSSAPRFQLPEKNQSNTAFAPRSLRPSATSSFHSIKSKEKLSTSPFPIRKIILADTKDQSSGTPGSLTVPSDGMEVFYSEKTHPSEFSEDNDGFFSETTTVSETPSELTCSTVQGADFEDHPEHKTSEMHEASSPRDSLSPTHRPHSPISSTHFYDLDVSKTLSSSNNEPTVAIQDAENHSLGGPHISLGLLHDSQGMKSPIGLGIPLGFLPFVGGDSQHDESQKISESRSTRKKPSRPLSFHGRKDRRSQDVILHSPTSPLDDFDAQIIPPLQFGEKNSTSQPLMAKKDGNVNYTSLKEKTQLLLSPKSGKESRKEVEPQASHFQAITSPRDKRRTTLYPSRNDKEYKKEHQTIRNLISPTSIKEKERRELYSPISKKDGIHPPFRVLSPEPIIKKELLEIIISEMEEFGKIVLGENLEASFLRWLTLLLNHHEHLHWKVFSSLKTFFAEV